MDLFGGDSEFLDDPERHENDSADIDPGSNNESAATGPGLLHPRAMEICLGHDRVEQVLMALFSGGRMPHGLIFSGPKGIGKATMAYRFARYILATPVADPAQDNLFGNGPASAPDTMAIAPDHPVFRRVASGGHPDLMSVERAYDEAKNHYKSGVDVEEIRKITPFLRMTAAEGGWRVVIIDDADTMNRSAQNAILKILEEPPKNTLLILVAHSIGALIPTIRSRAQVIGFSPLPDHVIAEVIARGAISARTEALCALAGGSAGRALELAQEDGLETLARITAAFAGYPAWNWADLHVIADDLGRAGRESAYHGFESLLRWTIGRLAILKARGTEPPAGPLAPLEDFWRDSSLEQLLEICEKLDGHFDKVNGSNLDKRHGVLGAFSLIAA